MLGSCRTHSRPVLSVTSSSTRLPTRSRGDSVAPYESFTVGGVAEAALVGSRRSGAVRCQRGFLWPR